MPCRFSHDPDATLTYGLDLYRILDGETISDAAVSDIQPIGFSAAVSDFSTSRVAITCSGGTLFERYKVTVHVTFASGQEDDYTLTFDCRNR